MSGAHPPGFARNRALRSNARSRNPESSGQGVGAGGGFQSLSTTLGWGETSVCQFGGGEERFNSEHAKFSNNNGKINRYLLKFKDFNIRLMGSFCQYHWQNKNRRNRKHGRQGKSMVLAKP